MLFVCANPESHLEVALEDRRSTPVFFSYARFYTPSSQNSVRLHQKYKRKSCFLWQKASHFRAARAKSDPTGKKNIYFFLAPKIFTQNVNLCTQLPNEKTLVHASGSLREGPGFPPHSPTWLYPWLCVASWLFKVPFYLALSVETM